MKKIEKKSFSFKFKILKKKVEKKKKIIDHCPWILVDGPKSTVGTISAGSEGGSKDSWLVAMRNAQSIQQKWKKKKKRINTCSHLKTDSLERRRKKRKRLRSQCYTTIGLGNIYIFDGFVTLITASWFTSGRGMDMLNH